MNVIIESQRSETNHAHAGDEQLRRDQQLLHEQLLEQNRDLREAHMKSLTEMEELKRFQGSTFDGFSRRKLIEDRDSILELTATIQELQNEVNCMNDARDSEDTESVRSVLCWALDTFQKVSDSSKVPVQALRYGAMRWWI